MPFQLPISFLVDEFKIKVINNTTTQTWPTINPRRKNKITENMDNVTGTTTPKKDDSLFLWFSSSTKGKNLSTLIIS